MRGRIRSGENVQYWCNVPHNLIDEAHLYSATMSRLRTSENVVVRVRLVRYERDVT
jgi:hypothetical protein